MSLQELALYSADSMADNSNSPNNNNTVHLAEFSGFKGRSDHARPTPDEVSPARNPVVDRVHQSIHSVHTCSKHDLFESGVA